MVSEKTESNVQLRGGYKLKKITRKNFLIAYAVLQCKPIIKFLKVFKMWRYVMDEKTKSVRMFKDKRSAQAYINYQTNPEMNDKKK